MNFGYARVSTKDQSLELQIQALRAAGAEKIFTDETSGKNIDREGLKLVFAGLREGDKFIVWKLDRLARSVKNLIDLVDEIKKRGAAFVSLTEKIDTSGPAGNFFFHVMAALSEMERALIVERTKAGLEVARKAGKIGGRKRLMTNSKILSAAQLYLSGTPIKTIAKDLGVSQPTLYRALKQRGLN